MDNDIEKLLQDIYSEQQRQSDLDASISAVEEQCEEDDQRWFSELLHTVDHYGISMPSDLVVDESQEHIDYDQFCRLLFEHDAASRKLSEKDEALTWSLHDLMGAKGFGEYGSRNDSNAEKHRAYAIGRIFAHDEFSNEEKHVFLHVANSFLENCMDPFELPRALSDDVSMSILIDIGDKAMKMIREEDEERQEELSQFVGIRKEIQSSLSKLTRVEVSDDDTASIARNIKSAASLIIMGKDEEFMATAEYEEKVNHFVDFFNLQTAANQLRISVSDIRGLIEQAIRLELHES